MSTIRIKRSGVTGSPSALSQGEMAYSFLGGTQSNGGDRLYIGTGTETGGVAANIEAIGGKYFTSKLSHVPGTLTANAAVIVDSSGKIDVFNVTSLSANNVTITGALSANSSNGSSGQVLTSNGSGVYWSTPTSGVTNLGQTSNTSTVTITSSTGTSAVIQGAGASNAGLITATDQTIGGNKTFNSDVIVSGNFTVNGTTTTVNSTTVTVDDINIELGSVATPTDTTANGGGITLKGSTDKTFNWLNATGAWTSSENISVATGKAYFINGTSVLNSTTLGSGVTSSSLTSVGTITSGTWSGSFGAVSGANLTNLTAGNLTGTIPSTVLGNSIAYVGTTAIALNRASASQSLTGISSVTLPGSTSGSIIVQPTAVAGTTTITLPATTGTVITSGDTGTVTNTMLAGSIAITKLTASTISGVSLGNNLNALTIGTGLSGSSYNGSAGVTIAANIATTSSLGIASFDSSTFAVSSGAVSLTAIDGGTY
jgi:hypothetical protein